MIIVSDSNMLSSLASANALNLLHKLYKVDTIYIPIAVEQELQQALKPDKEYIKQIFQNIATGKIKILPLTANEQALTKTLPPKLHDGEREGIILCYRERHSFLCNDKRAIRYCHQHGIKVVDLPLLLNLFWTRHIISKYQAETLIQKMVAQENLHLSEEQLAQIFAPRRTKR